jgi:A/G-specific adenine glycosylase
MLSLINWYQKNKRELPWRKTSDPYKIWLSEIILQQTRVNQGIDYYYRFIEKFPTVQDLAKASIDEVLLLWQGLGYYSRARNMYSSAKLIAENNNGNFPLTFSELKKLKGVGDYTAAAIASIVYNEAVPVLDGNVYRVLSRYYAIEVPVDIAKNKLLFLKHAENILDRRQPGIFNQAIMELGAIICTPKQPKCAECPIANKCIAFNSRTTELYPVKFKKTVQKYRFFYFFIVRCKDEVLIEKRLGKDIWEELYQFPLLESAERLEETEIATNSFLNEPTHKNLQILAISAEIKHVLSHQIIKARFIHIKTDTLKTFKTNGLIRVKIKEISDYAMPRIITRYLGMTSIL